MMSFALLGATAVVLMVGGLAAVLAELLKKDPRALLAMMDDSRRFAEAPLAAPAATPRDAATPAAPQTQAERTRLAA
jgi:hypothetical protein